MRKLLLLFSAALLASCHPIEEYEQNNRGDFEALWTIVDEHYCFFDEKDVDWDAVKAKYEPKVDQQLTRKQLFDICAEMINELKDGHTNLSAPFETSYYRKWWSDYPQNFDQRIIEEYYFEFNYKQLGNVIYGMLPQNVGYVLIPSFSSGLGAGNIDWILSELKTANGLIIDLRNNGGGSMSYAEEWVRHFITEKHRVGYMVHKTGPAHNDFDTPYPIEFEPLTGYNFIWVKPVVVLTNRSTFSAANYMVMCMKELPNVTHAGATTGGGAGMPMSYELPGGWSVRMSAVKVLDPQMRTTEFGIEPDKGCAINMNLHEHDRDAMLDFAVSLIK